MALSSASSVLRRVAGFPTTGFLVTGFLVTGFLAVAASAPVKAEPGPCRPDQNGGLICGENPGAARIIDGTISPSRRLGLAWRSPDRPPTEEAEEGKVESLLIRLADGAVLWRAEGLYWNTGAMHANHYDEDAVWSPDSRFAVVTTDVRWWTHTLRLFAIGADEKPLVLDLRAIMEPAVRRHVPRNVKDGDFAISGSADGQRPRLTIDDRGVIKALVVISAPKQDPDAVAVFDVTFQAFQRNGELGAREVSIRRSRKTP
jgi:hypothetical protein